MTLSSGCLLSFDVGIKHLAFCLLDVSGGPVAWDCLNLVTEAPPLLCHVSCRRKAVYVSPEGAGFCKKHAEKSSAYFLPVGSLSKMSKEDLVTRLEGKGLSTTGSKEVMKKEVQRRTLAMVKKAPKASELSLIEVARTVTKRLDVCLPVASLTGLKAVLIENQISPIATRMKTLQGVLTEYFVIRFPEVAIHYVSSGNKLRKAGEEDKERTYKENKTLAVDRCREALQEGSEWRCFFDEWKGKRDDLADCFLQGKWWLHKDSGKGTIHEKR